MAFALLDHAEEKATIDEILTGTFREKDRQINFAIEELEKIKAEIEQMDFDMGDYYDHTNTIREMISKVIDKHISELKKEREQ